MWCSVKEVAGSDLIQGEKEEKGKQWPRKPGKYKKFDLNLKMEE